MTQIQNKFLADNSVDGRVFRLRNNELLRGRNAGGTADVDILKITPANAVEVQNLLYVESGLPIPSDPKQYATIEFIINYILGKTDAKDAVRVLATSDTVLTGSSPLILDGISLANATPVQRVGLTFQTDAKENGIYDYSESAGTYTLTRSSDFDQLLDASGREVTQGAYFLVAEGTLFAGYEVQLTTNDPIVIGTTNLTFVRYPSTLVLTAGDMLVRVGNDFAVDLAPLGGLESTNLGNPAGQLRVKVDTAVLEKDKTTRLDPSSGAVVSKKDKKAPFTLSGTDVSNGYVDLVDVAADSSVKLEVAGAGSQFETTDFTVNYTGGASSKTRVTFAGGLALAGVSALAAGDVITVIYRAF